MRYPLLLGLGLALGTVACTPSAPPAPPPLTDYTRNSGAPRAPEQLAVTFDHADLGIRVDPVRHWIEGDARLTFGVTAPLKRVVLDLDRNLPIDSVEVDGKALPVSGYRNPDGRLSIDLPRPLGAGAKTTVRVVYHGSPHTAVHAPWDGGFVWATTPDGKPWVATAVEGEGCDLFWPCIDHPQGRPKLVDEHITVPAPLVAVGNGVAMGMDEANGMRTYHWRSHDVSTYGVALNIAPYRELSASYKSRFGNVIPLHYWYVDDEKKAKQLFAEFPAMLDFLESAVGPYPFGTEKMGVAETPFKGMEHQTVNAYGNEYAKNVYGYDDLLQHELAHEWFGNQMTNANWDDMWLHEAFATYMQPAYAESIGGKMSYFASLMQIRSRIANHHPIVSGTPRREEDVYEDERGGPGQDIYNKGALMLHTLRNLIGDEAFYRAARELVYGTDHPVPGNFAPRYGTTKEYIDIVDRVTGKDMQWFFNVYLYQAALPEIVATREGQQLHLAWSVPGKGPFPMPVDVRVGDRIVSLPMTDGRGDVTLPEGASYTVDPDSKLLRRDTGIEAYRDYMEKRKPRPH
ncbi:MAG: M1 family metallopeptidase [Luteibacter sp.]|uniref:M1 family metallopeptidase n=1 Tax=Luteibacter sp. TaxID=1886636 RepID=UPI0028070AD1|nr:M1 family metallopeptidase [Luteibacter sp.]MDQ7994961.1 M1 family metallopeptidase [Luteibacter sp.]MDQ8047523.1 M1 family metallopeptidase [Luteibacter sp.]